MKIEKIIISLQIVFVFLTAFSLWYKIFLPYSYYLAATATAILLIVSMVKKVQHRYLLFQILLIYMLINNIYGLATQYSVLPYGDSYWEYGVVRTFLQSDRVYTIPEQSETALMLTWFSGWPLIHTLALILSRTSGISPFHVILLLPIIVGISSFLVVYLFLEKFRSTLNTNREIVYLGLLIYTFSPDVIFERTQFVRLDLGLLWLNFLFYFIYTLIYQPLNQKRKFVLLTTLITLLLVITHHFASFIAMSFLLLLFIVQTLGKHIGKTKIGNKLFASTFDSHTISLALLMMICIFIWWDSFGTIVWPTVASGTTRFIRVITGTREIEFYAPQPHYPVQLTPTWALMLIRLRDIAIFLPSLFGLFFLWIKKPKIPATFFIVYSTLTFGLLFVIDDLTFKMEPFRLLALAIPFIALLTAIAYNEIKSKSKRVWNLFLPSIVILLILSSFIGLWGHGFAPLHLYNPTISASEVGENTDPTRLSDFFNGKIQVENLGLIRSDDIGSLILLLNASQFNKIRKATPENFQKIGATGTELFVEVSDLNSYQYYASVYSPIKSPEYAKTFAEVLRQYLCSKFNRIYDDGTYRFWEK